MKVRVYRNLHKKCLSVQHKTPKGWRLWKHVDKASLINVEFKVYETGRQKVLKEKQKNVHAFVIGDWVEENLEIIKPSPVYYNPYKTKQFTKLETGEEILFSKKVTIEPSLIIVDCWSKTESN